MSRKIILSLAALLLTSQAQALQYPATCRGPTATVTRIEGFDTQKANLSAEYTLPDALAYCHYSIGYSRDQKPSPSALMKCAREFMAMGSRTNLAAEANCKTGVIGIPNFQTNPIKMPVHTDCSSGGVQITTLFRMLCPTYTGAIEIQDRVFTEKDDKEPE